MPFIHVQIAAARGVTIDASALAQVLTALAASQLHKKPELTAVRVEPVDANGWFIGNESMAGRSQSTVHVQIQVTEGTNTPDEKARFIAAAFDAVAAAVGELHSASYVVVEEIAADGWGYGGRTQAARRDAATAAAR